MKLSILTDLCLPSRVNQCFYTTGLDDLKDCRDTDHFRAYPHLVEYRYNSRGFRDQEWPTDADELQSAVWCIGDSFTVGMGAPIQHTWPYILQQRTGLRSINISMDGASNNWIARQLVLIMLQIKPAIAIVQWSYLERREDQPVNSELNRYWQEFYLQVRNPDWPPVPDIENFATLPISIQIELLTSHDQSWRQNITDEQLRLGHIKSTDIEDIQNTRNLVRWVETMSQQHNVRLIHSFIPKFANHRAKSEFFSQINIKKCIGEIPQLDWARDHHHYDCKTAQWVVDHIVDLL